MTDQILLKECRVLNAQINRLVEMLCAIGVPEELVLNILRETREDFKGYTTSAEES